MGVRFANDIDWKKEELKSVVGQSQRRQRRETKKKTKQEVVDVNVFFAFLFVHPNLKTLLENNIHGMPFLMIYYESCYCDEAKLHRRFSKGDLRAERLDRGQLLMATEWKESMIQDGTYNPNTPIIDDAKENVHCQ